MSDRVGAVNDAQAMSTAFEPWIPVAEHVFLRDAQATTATISAALRAAVAQLQPGDRFLFHFSGHGAQLRAGDIGTNCLCPVDFDFTPAHALQVADLHAIFALIPDGVTARWVADACHSGDDEREMHPVLACKARTFVLDGAPVSFRWLPGRGYVDPALPPIVLVSGCRSDQTSADTVDAEGRPCGALTSRLCAILGSQSIALADLGPALCARLEADGYTQRPQISGRPELITRPFFE